jgi:hypothetical protein
MMQAVSVAKDPSSVAGASCSIVRAADAARAD